MPEQSLKPSWGTEGGEEQLPRVLLGRYRLDAMLAEGGMGRVYRGTQLTLDRPVAIKVLKNKRGSDDGFRKRFMLEASVSARLHHPNIVVVHDYGESEAGELFMAMELLEGLPLNTAVKRTGPFTPPEVREIGTQICRALRVAHAVGLAHRDLKPANVFLLDTLSPSQDEPELQVKVVDFGLVKLFNDEAKPLAPALDGDLTGGDVMLGSPRYMSPEQILGGEVDARTDIYSLGVLLFTVATGRPPFLGTTRIEVLRQHLHANPPSLMEAVQGTDWAHHPVDPAIDAVIQRCMQKEPQDRYQSVDDVIRDLRQGPATPVTSRDLSRSAPLSMTLGSGDIELTSASNSAVRERRIEEALAPTDYDHNPDFDFVAPKEEREEGKDQRMLLMGLGVVVLAVLALVLLLQIGGDPAPPEPVAIPVTQPSPQTESSMRAPEPSSDAPRIQALVQVTITSEPSGATVSSGGVIYGTTPLTRAFPQTEEDAQRIFLLESSGYQPYTLSESLSDRQVELHAEMIPFEPAAPAPTPMRRIRSSRMNRATRSPMVSEPSPMEEAVPMRTRPIVPVVD